jgi:hypothetical protein
MRQPYHDGVHATTLSKFKLRHYRGPQWLGHPHVLWLEWWGRRGSYESQVEQTNSAFEIQKAPEETNIESYPSNLIQIGQLVCRSCKLCRDWTWSSGTVDMLMSGCEPFSDMPTHQPNWGRAENICSSREFRLLTQS